MVEGEFGTRGTQQKCSRSRASQDAAVARNSGFALRSKQRRKRWLLASRQWCIIRGDLPVIRRGCVVIGLLGCSSGVELERCPWHHG